MNMITSPISLLLSYLLETRNEQPIGSGEFNYIGIRLDYYSPLNQLEYE